MSNQKEEMDLLKSLIAGDENSAREFIKRYGGLIRCAIRSIRLRSDVIKEEDLFNGAMLHILV
jgi:DNA-directed RNA polymerase specialized sigma subunit